MEFGSFYQKQFDANQAHSGTQKQLFTNLVINLWLPIDTDSIEPGFCMLDTIEDEPEKMRRLQYFCEVPDYTTAEVLLLKSIDNFNQQLQDESALVKLNQDLNMYSIRIAKKKSGKPNTDYPKVDLSQNVVDVDFTNFCVVYTYNAIQSLVQHNVPTLVFSKAKSHPAPPKQDSLFGSSGLKSSMIYNETKTNQTVNTESSNAITSPEYQKERGIMIQNQQPSQACCNCLIF